MDIKVWRAGRTGESGFGLKQRLTVRNISDGEGVERVRGFYSLVTDFKDNAV